jgi:PPE-repeat protein
MDYAALPPEINSARIEAGPGPSSLIAAASTWGELANQLEDAAQSWNNIIRGLNGTWLGASSDAMKASAAQQIAWLHEAASFAEQTAAQAEQAVGAYEQARASMVPLASVTANRALLSMLVATNFFGQNSPAIAETEARYMTMWAQDAAAMIGYHATSSTAAAALPKLSAAPVTSDPAAAAVAAPAPLDLGNIFDTSSFIGATFQSIIQAGTFTATPLALVALMQTQTQIGQGQQALGYSQQALAQSAPSTAGTSASGEAATQASYTASMGNAARMGGWSSPASANVRLIAQTAPLSAAEAEALPTVIPPPLLGMGGRATDKGSSKPKTGKEIPGVVMPRTPAGG